MTDASRRPQGRQGRSVSLLLTAVGQYGRKGGAISPEYPACQCKCTRKRRKRVQSGQTKIRKTDSQSGSKCRYRCNGRVNKNMSISIFPTKILTLTIRLKTPASCLYPVLQGKIYKKFTFWDGLL